MALELAPEDYRALTASGVDLADVLDGYLGALLWTTHDELFPDADNDLPATIPGVDRSEHGERMDAFYGPDDIDKSYVERVEDEILAFTVAHPLAVRMYLSKRSSSDLGHDLLLTRDGHGTGFWDRGLGTLGDHLAEHARSLGSSEDLSDGALCSDPRGVRTFIAGTLY